MPSRNTDHIVDRPEWLPTAEQKSSHAKDSGQAQPQTAEHPSPSVSLAAIVETTCQVMTKAGNRIDQLIRRVDQLCADKAALVAALQEVREYLSERADAEYTTDSAAPRGNEEMRLLVEVNAALEKAGAKS